MAALDCVVEQAINAVAVVLIILCGVDSTLRGDGMRTAWRILITETSHAVTELAECRHGRTAGQTAANHDDLKFAAIVWPNESGMVLVTRPFAHDLAGRNSGVDVVAHNGW